MNPNVTRDRIENAYKSLGYQDSWSFMACPEANFADPRVLFVTLNPGGKEGLDWGDPQWSQERGSSYLHESWGEKPEGKASLQIQIQRLFDLLSVPIDEVASGYFIPFRSRREKTLPEKSDAVSFALALWKDVIQGLTPEYVICLGMTVGNHMKSLFDIKYVEKKCTGWGNVKMSVGHTSYGGRFVILPHLSTFKLFSSDKCISHFRAALSMESLSHA